MDLNDTSIEGVDDKMVSLNSSQEGLSYANDDEAIKSNDCQGEFNGNLGEDSLSVEASDEISETSVHSFTELQNAISSTYIPSLRISGVYKMQPGDSPIILNNVMLQSITGADGTVIDGCGIDRLFEVPFNVYCRNILFKNIIFKNGKCSLSGGAGSLARPLTFENCTFINNSAPGGGVIAPIGNTAFLLKNCVFINNSANTGGVLIGGEAINCSFINNSATDGGAIYNSVAKDCNFTGNFATNGGAIYNSDANGCIFTDNSATNGGVVFSDSGNAKITNCLFISNSAEDNGGAIYVKNSNNCLIDNSDFISCSASNSGNAIFWESGSGLTIASSSFEDCSAGSRSSLKFYNNASDYEVRDCLFDIEPTGIMIHYSSLINADNLKVFQGEDGSIVVNLSNILGPMKNKIVTFFVGKTLFQELTDSDGIARFDFTRYFHEINEYDVEIIFDGDEQNYYNTTNITALIVPIIKFDTYLSAEDFSAYNGEESYLIVNLTGDKGPIANKKIIFSIESDVYESYTNSYGLASFDVKENLRNAGEYKVNVCFGGNDFYNAVSKNVTIIISKFDAVLDINDTVGYKNEYCYLPVYLSNIRGPIANKTVEFTINGGRYSIKTDSNGKISLDIWNYYTDLGKFYINASFNDDLHNPISKDIELNLIKRDSNITFSGEIIIDYGVPGFIYYEVVGGCVKWEDISVVGQPDAVIELDDNKITVSNVDGGNYLLRVLTTPDENHEAVVGFANIIVNVFSTNIIFKNDIVFDYGKSGHSYFSVEGGILLASNCTVIGQEGVAKISIDGNDLSISGLDVGRYILNVKSTPNKGYSSSEKNLTVIVNKVSTGTDVAKFSTYYKSGKTWTVKLYDSKTKSPLSNFKVTVRFYTGNNFKTYEATTNSKGIATFKASNWATGKHKVVVTSSKIGYDFKPVTTTIEIKKTIKLSYRVEPKSLADGSLVSVWITANKKPVNNLKVKLLVYTGKKYQTFNLITGNYKKSSKVVYKGYVGYGTNMLSVGKHIVVIKPNDVRYTNSKTTFIVIKKTAKKVAKSTTIISMGKKRKIY